MIGRKMDKVGRQWAVVVLMLLVRSRVGRNVVCGVLRSALGRLD